MDLRQELLKEHSKAQAQRIANYIGDDSHLFGELMDLFLNEPYRINQRAAWIVSHCADTYPHLIQPYLKPLIENLQGPIHVAVKRNTVRVLQDIEIPDNLKGILAEKCFEFLTSNQEPVAVRVFSMTILAHMANKLHDLKKELSIIIEDQMPFASAGFISRGTKVLKQIKTWG